MSEIIPSGDEDKKLVADDQVKKDNVVAYDTYQKSIAQEKAARARANEAETKLNDLLNARKLDEENKLNEKGEYKKLVELRENELSETRKKLAETEGRERETQASLQDTWKLSAFFEELPGHVKRQEYLNFVDLDSIVIDPETRRVDKASVQSAASKFMESYADLVDTKKFNGLPGNAAAPGNSKRYSRDEWKSLPLKDKKENWSRRPAI